MIKPPTLEHPHCCSRSGHILTALNLEIGAFKSRICKDSKPKVPAIQLLVTVFLSPHVISPPGFIELNSSPFFFSLFQFTITAVRVSTRAANTVRIVCLVIKFIQLKLKIKNNTAGLFLFPPLTFPRSPRRSQDIDGKNGYL